MSNTNWVSIACGPHFRTSGAAVAAEWVQHGCQETEEGVYLEAPEDTADRRTQAEKRYDEAMAKREADRVRKHADKSHRQRVAEFNTYLSKLTEHHDIPKVGPG